MHLDANGAPTSPHKRRFDLCGDLAASIVLDQLCYWWMRGTRIIYGVEWRAKPREYLAAELGMTLRQVTRTLAILKKCQLIETSQHLFGGYGERRNVMHYRLLPRAIPLLMPSKNGPSVPSDGHPECTPNVTLLDHSSPITYSDSSVSSKEEDTTESSASGLAPADPIKYVQKEKSFEGKTFKAKAYKVHLSPKKNPSPKAPLPAAPAGGKPHLSGAEMIAAKAATGSFPGKKPKLAKKSLFDVWVSAYAETYIGVFVKPFTDKQHGQLKLLHKAFVAAGVPDPIEQIRIVVSNWSVFVTKATTDEKAFELPKRPEVGVALKFAQTAMNMKALGKVDAVKWNDKFGVQSMSQLGTDVASKSSHKPATLAELEALTGEKLKGKAA